jgi:hypothetical protein
MDNTIARLEKYFARNYYTISGYLEIFHKVIDLTIGILILCLGIVLYLTQNTVTANMIIMDRLGLFGLFYLAILVGS